MSRVVTKEEPARATRLQKFSAARLLADGKTVVKTGPTVRMAEADTMRLVRQKTNMPLPELYSAYKDEETGWVCIVMEHVQGKQLDEAWPLLSEDEKESIIQQLRRYFNELRQIQGTFIGGVDGSECEDQLFPEDGSRWGPYQNEAEFKQGLIDDGVSGRRGIRTTRSSICFAECFLIWKPTR